MFRLFRAVQFKVRKDRFCNAVPSQEFVAQSGLVNRTDILNYNTMYHVKRFLRAPSIN